MLEKYACMDFSELISKLTSLFPDLNYQGASEEAGKLDPPNLREEFPADEDHTSIKKDYLQGL